MEIVLTKMKEKASVGILPMEVFGMWIIIGCFVPDGILGYLEFSIKLVEKK